jgi:hypothetical protein
VPLTVGPPASGAVAPVGISAPDGWSVPAGMPSAHVRLDVRLGEPESAQLRELGWLLAEGATAVELAVHGRADSSPTLPAWCRELRLARVLALDLGEASTSEELLALVREAVERDSPIGVGTNSHFSEICRRPPPAAGADFLCWSAHPQVHASDDRSVIENLPGLGAQVRTAVSLRPSLPPVLSALRIGPPGNRDPRGSTDFGAAWAVGAFAELQRAGIHSVTVAGGPGREAVMAVAAAVMSAHGAPLREVGGADAGIAALAWGGREVGMLVANLRPADRSVTVALPGDGPVIRSPLVDGGAVGGCERRSPDGLLELRLGPYEALSLAARR